MFKFGWSAWSGTSRFRQSSSVQRPHSVVQLRLGSMVWCHPESAEAVWIMILWVLYLLTMNFDCQHYFQEPFQIWERQPSILPRHFPAHDIFIELLLMQKIICLGGHEWDFWDNSWWWILLCEEGNDMRVKLWEAVTQTELTVQNLIIL